MAREAVAFLFFQRQTSHVMSEQYAGNINQGCKDVLEATAVSIQIQTDICLISLDIHKQPIQTSCQHG
jgi:hypothetical protein